MEQGLVHQRKAVRDDLAYYRTRFATEYALSLSVPNAAIADIHRRLAEGYRQRIDELGEMRFRGGDCADRRGDPASFNLR